MRSGLRFLVVVAAGFVLAARPVMGAPRTEEYRPTTFSHDALDRILAAHVKDGMVDYAAIRARSMPALDAYVASLASADVATMARAEQLAFWLNAYNALVIQSVASGVTPQAAVGRAAFFMGRKFQVAGKSRSLQEIETESIRLIFQDPRVHFALVCGSKGCPMLSAAAYRAEALDETLEARARAFVNDPSKVRLDREKRIAYLSSIFKWYEKDFPGTVLSYVGNYLSEADKAALADGKWEVHFVDYDWTLNGVAPRVESPNSVERIAPGF